MFLLEENRIPTQKRCGNEKNRVLQEAHLKEIHRATYHSKPVANSYSLIYHPYCKPFKNWRLPSPYYLYHNRQPQDRNRFPERGQGLIFDISIIIPLLPPLRNLFHSPSIFLLSSSTIIKRYVLGPLCLTQPHCCGSS